MKYAEVNANGTINTVYNDDTPYIRSSVEQLGRYLIPITDDDITEDGECLLNAEQKIQEAQIEGITQRRKKAESEGVIYNGVRYSGSAENRQALFEALQAAEKHGWTEFVKWKDSDGNYHSNHPVSDVEGALDLICSRRSGLIEKEGIYTQKVIDGIEFEEDW